VAQKLRSASEFSNRPAVQTSIYKSIVFGSRQILNEKDVKVQSSGVGLFLSNAKQQHFDMTCNLSKGSLNKSLYRLAGFVLEGN
jgi:hypothetical protein